MAANKPDIKALLAQMPDVDKPGEESKFTGPDPGAAEDVYAAILAGGRDSLLELISMVRDPVEPGDNDFRAGYVLHGLAIHVGRPENKELRQAFTDILASVIESDDVSKGIKGLLIRELQVAGDKEVVTALGKHLTDEDLCEYAAQALVAIGDGAGAQLRRALRGAEGRCRLTIVQNLGAVREERSVRALRRALQDEDRDVRIAAAWALAQIADSRSADAILKAADAEQGWERIQATKACLVLAENLLGAGKKSAAREVYARLRDSRSDPSEEYVREAAERGLDAIGEG